MILAKSSWITWCISSPRKLTAWIRSCSVKHNMLDYINELNTIYSMLTMKRYLYGLKGNSVKCRSCPRNCKCGRLLNSHCEWSWEGQQKDETRASRPAFSSVSNTFFGGWEVGAKASISNDWYVLLYPTLLILSDVSAEDGCVVAFLFCGLEGSAT